MLGSGTRCICQSEDKILKIMQRRPRSSTGWRGIKSWFNWWNRVVRLVLHSAYKYILAWHASNHLLLELLPPNTSTTSLFCPWSRRHVTRQKQIQHELAFVPINGGCKLGNHQPEYRRTISSAPRRTPHKTLLNQRPPSRASSGSSTNSANGFSSKVSVNHGPDVAGLPLVLVGRLEEGAVGGEWVTVGVMFKNDLNPTCLSSG